MLGVHCALLSWNENVNRHVLGVKWTRAKGGQLKGQAGRWYSIPVRTAQTEEWVVDTWRTYIVTTLGLPLTSDEPVRSYCLGTPVAGTPVPVPAAAPAASATSAAVSAAGSCGTVQQQLSKLKKPALLQALKDMEVPGLAKSEINAMAKDVLLSRVISETLARTHASPTATASGSSTASPTTAAPAAAPTAAPSAAPTASPTAAPTAAGSTSPPSPSSLPSPCSSTASPPAPPAAGTASGSSTASPTAAAGTASGSMLTVVISAPNFPQPYVMDTSKLPKRRPAYETKKADGTGYERKKWTLRAQEEYLRKKGAELAPRGPDTVVVAGLCAATLLRQQQHRSRVVEAGRVSSCGLRDEMGSSTDESEEGREGRAASCTDESSSSTAQSDEGREGRWSGGAKRAAPAGGAGAPAKQPKKLRYRKETVFHTLHEFQTAINQKLTWTDSGGANNCLYYATALATGRLHHDRSQQAAAADAIDLSWRTAQHEKLIEKLPPPPPDGLEPAAADNGSWDAGFDRARATEVFDKRLFCGDAHIHMLTNTLKRPIYVSETCRGSGIGRHLRVMRYSPGFMAATAVTKAEVGQRPDDALFVHLAGGHFSALLPLELLRRPAPRNLSALSAACGVVDPMVV
jgi:hypothetical protein